MSERTLSPDAALAAIVKSAQYLGGMVSHQDLWPQLGRLIRRFFATDVAAFASRQPDGSVHLLHCDAADPAVCEHLAVLASDSVKAVFDSGFLVTAGLALPAPHALAFLPLGPGRRHTEFVMILGQCGSEAPSKDSLGLYLGLAGLIETTLDRLTSQHRFLSMADNVPELLFEITRQATGPLKLTYASRGAREVLGISPETLLENADMLFAGFPDEEREALENALLASAASGERLHMTLHWRGPDKAERHLLFNAKPAPGDEAGLAWDGAIQDVSERERLQEESRRNLTRLNKSMENAIQAVAATIEMRDPYTAGHQRRVAELATRLAQDLGLAEEEVHGIRLAAAIHDIGKIHVPAEILSYPGRLPEIEFALIKAHPRIGYDILKNVDFPWPVAEMVYQHHEHLDGSGYPRGLKGDAIMLGARIITVADVVEAIDLYRPYRPGLGIDAALGEITTHRGRFYDERIVDCCLSLFREQGFGFAETTDPDIWRVKS